MADAPTRAQRAAALEEKRRRLDDLKKRRTQRGEAAPAAVAAAANLDEYIDGLLNAPGAAAPAASPTESAAVAAGASTVERAVSVDEAEADGDTATAPAPSAASSSAPPPPVRHVETFTASTQTELEDFPEISGDDDEEEPATAPEPGDAGTSETGAPLAGDDVAPEEAQPKVLSLQEVRKDVASDSFVSFINTASKKVERLLGASVLDDLLVDYAGASTGSPQDQKDSDESRFVASRSLFECTDWTTGRDVTDIDWSLLHRELFLSTYNRPSTAAPGAAAPSAAARDTPSASVTPRQGELRSDGVAAVWNLTMPARPEHIFICGSPVTTGRFHPTEPTLLLGGCESGQLVIWDTRAGRLPVQKSALASVVGASSKGHTHPIGNMEVVEGGLGLVTSASDGRVNFWSLANLREPVDSTQVSDSVSCFAVVPESEALLLGDEMGSLYTIQSSIQSSGQRSSRKQVRKLEAVDSEGQSSAHYGMVTSLSTQVLKKGAASRVAAQSKGFLRGSGGLVLSCGVDWTIKLWAPAYSETPLLSMVNHSYDYMTDVKWCPSHPAVFATASSNGTLGLWNLATSFEEPLTGQEGLLVEPDAMSGRGLNRLKWSADGRRIAVSSGDRVHVLSMTEEVIRPKGDEDTKLMNQLMARGLINRQ